MDHFDILTLDYIPSDGFLTLQEPQFVGEKPWSSLVSFSVWGELSVSVSLTKKIIKMCYLNFERNKKPKESDSFNFPFTKIPNMKVDHSLLELNAS